MITNPLGWSESDGPNQTHGAEPTPFPSKKRFSVARPPDDNGKFSSFTTFCFIRPKTLYGLTNTRHRRSRRTMRDDLLRESAVAFYAADA